MSIDKVRKALDAHLESFDDWAALASKPIAWENSAYRPANGVPFVKVDLLPAQTTNPEFGAGTRDVQVLRGIYQLRLNHPINAGPGAAAARADALVAHFPRGSSYTYSGVTVRLFRTPSVAPAYVDGSYYVVPVSIEYTASIFP